MNGTNYSTFCRDRDLVQTQKDDGGGALILNKKNFAAEEINAPNCKFAEIIAVKVTLTFKNLIAVNAYIPPMSNAQLRTQAMAELGRFIAHIKHHNTNAHMILVGVF